MIKEKEVRFITLDGYDAEVEGIDNQKPVMLHGVLYLKDGRLQRAIWYRDGVFVGGKFEYNLPAYVTELEFPPYVQKFQGKLPNV